MTQTCPTTGCIRGRDPPFFYSTKSLFMVCGSIWYICITVNEKEAFVLRWSPPLRGGKSTERGRELEVKLEEERWGV